MLYVLWTALEFVALVFESKSRTVERNETRRHEDADPVERTDVTIQGTTSAFIFPSSFLQGSVPVVVTSITVVLICNRRLVTLAVFIVMFDHF